MVVYTGNSNRSFSDANGLTQVVMPLDSYTTDRAGVYLQADPLEVQQTTGWVPNAQIQMVPNTNPYGLAVYDGVTGTGNQNFRTNSFDVSTGTYMQDGIVRNAENGSAVNNVAEFTFAPVEFTAVGDYYFKLTEVPGPQSSRIDYSDVQYIIKVTVSDDGKGGLTGEKVITMDGKEAQLVFRNHFESQKTSVDVEINKTVKFRFVGVLAPPPCHFDQAAGAWRNPFSLPEITDLSGCLACPPKCPRKGV